MKWLFLAIVLAAGRAQDSAGRQDEAFEAAGTVCPTDIGPETNCMDHEKSCYCLVHSQMKQPRSEVFHFCDVNGFQVVSIETRDHYWILEELVHRYGFLHGPVSGLSFRAIKTSSSSKKSVAVTWVGKPQSDYAVLCRSNGYSK